MGRLRDPRFELAVAEAALDREQRDGANRWRLLLIDLALLLLALLLVVSVGHLGSDLTVSFHPTGGTPGGGIDLNPAHLPAYALLSCLRMLLGLVLSVTLAIVVGSLTAHSPLAERLILPVVDVLQSVPVLGVLALVVPLCLRLLPIGQSGLEAAAIVAIVSGQVWNLIFCYHQALRTIPAELREAAAVYRFSGWQRFTRLELPAATIPLIWNAMMSFAGGWFFATQSEAISVGSSSRSLPGLGSYVALAISRQRLDCVAWALLAMLVVIVLSDQLLWRPLVAWSGHFRLDSATAAPSHRSWLLTLLQQSRALAALNALLTAASAPLARWLHQATANRRSAPVAPLAQTRAGWVIDGLLLIAAAVAIAITLSSSWHTLGARATLAVIGAGFLTMGRALAVVGLSTLIFLPLAVTIGLRPRLAAVLQPLILMAASIPANLLFPFLTVLFLWSGLPLFLGCVLLMALGAQWYVLFNATAGASAIPSDLREMAAVFRLEGRVRWRRLLLPALFGAWVTGAITASGAAWNASIVAEVVTWGHVRLSTPGLGSTIAEATAQGDRPRLLLALVVMSLFVVTLNRLLWRPLYRQAEIRYGA
jgi:NitT/TauT family transport system permease protein